MRWIVLALSLGATIVSLIHGVFAIWGLTSGGGTVMIGENAFTWMAAILLLVSAVLGLIGGILAFNRRRIGAIFIFIAAAVCIFVHPSTRIYGFVLLTGGVLAFFIRKPYEYNYEDEGDLEDEDEPDAEEEPRSFRGRREGLQELSLGIGRRERASRINLDREEYSLSDDGTYKMSEPMRIRSTKVCPGCGANVGIDHKFCHTCGRTLQGSRTTDADTSGFSLTPETAASVEPSEDEYGWNAESKREVKADGPYEDESGEENTLEDLPDGAVPHRVFVKPSMESEAEPEHPFVVSPDNSYQEFSNYARRRKRKRNSVARRIAGLLILLLAFSGAAWLLLSMQRVDDPVPPTVTQTPVTEPVEPVVVVPEPTIWEQLQIQSPTSGVVTGSSVNIRQSNTTESQVVTRLSAGAPVEFIELREGTPGPMPLPWFHIRIPSNGRDGWIYGQYFQPLDGRPSTLPAGYTDALLKSFGASRAEMSGNPNLGEPANQTSTTINWPGLTANFGTGGEVTRFIITGAQHVLQNNVVVGMLEDTLYRTVGFPSDYNRPAGQLRYVESGSGNTARGMGVLMESGKVTSITVGNL